MTGDRVSAMLGCDLAFPPDASPVAHCANKENQEIDTNAAFSSPITRPVTTSQLLKSIGR